MASLLFFSLHPVSAHLPRTVGLPRVFAHWIDSHDTASNFLAYFGMGILGLLLTKNPEPIATGVTRVRLLIFLAVLVVAVEIAQNSIPGRVADSMDIVTAWTGLAASLAVSRFFLPKLPNRFPNSPLHLMRQFRTRNFEERKLFIRGLFLVVVIRIALWTVPFRLTHEWVDRFQRPTGPRQDLDRRTIRLAVWAVEAAGRRMPGATCLTQSMALQILLGRMGQQTRLRLGVAKGQSGEIEAHAWVEAQGRIIAGNTVNGFHRYAALEAQPENNCYAKS